MCVVGAFAQSASKPASGAAQTAAKVDVNSADLKTLETLPGIGPAIANRIVDGRPYKTLSDLEKVNGLGKARLEALKDKVTFGPATPGQAAPSPKLPQAKQVTTPPAGAGPSSTAGGGAPAVKGGGSTVGKSKSAPAATTEKLAPGQRLNINTASAAELDKLPGIGPAKAQAIVDYRTQNGNFKSIEDIEKVKGIKGGVFSKIKDYIKVSD
jgi:competence protein ComEA